MAVLMVEDGSGRADANAFATAAEIDDILSENPYATKWAESYAKDMLAIRGTRLICDDIAARGWRWQGWPINSIQALPFPRNGLWTREGQPVASNIVPDAIKRAVAEVCERLAAEDFTAGATSGRTEQSVTMGRLSVTYGGGATNSTPAVIADWLYAPVLHWLDRTIRTVRA